MAERISQDKAIERLAQISGAGPLVEFYQHVTQEASGFSDKTGEVSESDYVQDPSLLIEAETTSADTSVRVRFLQSRVGARTTHAMEFVNGETFARVYPWGLSPFNLNPNQWEETTIGPGYVLAIDRNSISRQRALLDKFNEAVSSHSFTYSNVRPRSL